jgi:hypothetical protein
LIDSIYLSASLVSKRMVFLSYGDDAGRVLDFHAFRHTYVSSLAAGGVHPKDAQTLARHSTITLTMDRYTHSVRGATARALNALPDLTQIGPEQQTMKATGTYAPAPHGSQRAAEKRCTKSSANTGKKGGVKALTGCIKGKGLKLAGMPENVGFSAGSESLGRGGVEPPTHGFSVRCSTN